MSAILKLSGVSKRFGALLAIDNLSMHLNAGEALGVIGPNGSGKTTMFKETGKHRGLKREAKLILLYYVPHEPLSRWIPPWAPKQKQSSLAPGFSWSPYSTYILVEAGSQRYNVGTDTPKLWATSLGGVPEESNFLAALTLPSVIRRFRPPTRPCRFAASNPACVRSIIRGHYTKRQK